MHLDGLAGDEERLRYLAVRPAGRGQAGDPPLAGRERLDTAEHRPRPASHAAGGQLILCAGRERRGAAAVGQVHPLA